MTEAQELLGRVRELIKSVKRWSEWPDEADIGAVLTDVEQYLAKEVESHDPQS